MRFGADRDYAAGAAARAQILAPYLMAQQDAAAQAELDRLTAAQQKAESDAAAAQAYEHGLVPEDRTLTYVAVGVGALALLGLLAVVLKHRRGKKLRGYRRRRC